MQDAGNTEDEGMKQQRIKIVRDMISMINAKGRVDANISWWVSVLIAKSVAPPRMGGRTQCSSGTGGIRCRRRMRKRGWRKKTRSWSVQKEEQITPQDHETRSSVRRSASFFKEEERDVRR